MGRFLAQLGRSRHALGAAAGCLVAGLSFAAVADEAGPCGPRVAEAATVKEVREDGTIVTEDGRHIRLARAVLPPREWRKRAAAEIRRVFVAGQALVGATGEPDRHGRVAAALGAPEAEEPLSVRLVSAGLAWADPANHPPCLALLLARENDARESHRGFWADGAFSPLSAERPDEILEKRGEFALVEGTVLSVGVRPKRTYLNFGAFWNQDFTAYMDTDAADRILPAGMAPGDLEGRRVRIRGYLLEERGPAIAVTQPGQLELLDTR